MDDIKNTLSIKISILCLIFGLAMGSAAGWYLRQSTHHCPTISTTAAPEVKEDIKATSTTAVEYFPKKNIIYQDTTGGGYSVAPEKTDIDIKAAKPIITVAVNGQQQEITAAENEKYIFDKNKLQVTQSSQAAINIKIPTIDKTKRWAIGIGASKDGPAGIIAAPVYKDTSAWISGRPGNVMGGLMVQF